MNANNQEPKPTLSTGRRGGGMPRIMWLAVLVSILGAALLFRSQSASTPAGIGENQTVVTAPEVGTTLTRQAPPRSGDVDIAKQAPALTPEKNASTVPGKPVVRKSTPTKPKPVANTAPAAKKHTPPVKPVPHGPYVVQIGSFGDATNADKEASRLGEKGWDARVKVGNTSHGSIIYRVHIGYFKSRSVAIEFIRQNRSQMKDAIAVHR